MLGTQVSQGTRRMYLREPASGAVGTGDGISAGAGDAACVCAACQGAHGRGAGSLIQVII